MLLTYSMLVVVPVAVTQAICPAWSPLAGAVSIVFAMFLLRYSRPMERHVPHSEDPRTQPLEQTAVVPYSKLAQPRQRLTLTHTLSAPSKAEVLLTLGNVGVTTLATRLAYALKVRRLPRTLSLESMAPPNTKAVNAATALCRTTAGDKEWIYQHCMRTYLFGCAMAQQLGIVFDKEFLYVASALHDLAFTKPFDRDDTTFELLGARAAKKFAAEQGMEPHMQDAIHESIALHTSAHLQGNLDPETRLVSMGALADLGGIGLEDMTVRTKEDVVAAHPRMDLKRELCCLFDDHCSRKPWSPMAANRSMGFFTAVKLAPFDE